MALRMRARRTRSPNEIFAIILSPSIEQRKREPCNVWSLPPLSTLTFVNSNVRTDQPALCADHPRAQCPQFWQGSLLGRRIEGLRAIGGGGKPTLLSAVGTAESSARLARPRSAMCGRLR